MGEIKVGSVVQLKSGGPEMTIERIDDGLVSGEGRQATVVWFDEKRVVQRNAFPVSLLDVA